MRVRTTLPLCLIAAALLCAAACSSAPDNQGGSSQQPINAEDAATKKSTPAQRPAATDAPRGDATAARIATVYIIKKEGEKTTYNTLKPQIDSLATNYEGKVDFKYLDVTAPDHFVEVTQTSQLKEVEKFYSLHSGQSGTAAVFKTGDTKPTALIESEDNSNNPVESAIYKEKLENIFRTLAASQAVATPSPFPTPDRRTDKERIDGLAAEVQALKNVPPPSTDWPAYIILGMLGIAGIILSGLSLLMSRYGIRAEDELSVLRRDFEMMKGELETWRRDISKDFNDFKSRAARPRDDSSVKNTASNGPGWNDFQRLQDQIGGQTDKLQRLESRFASGEGESAQVRQSLLQMVSWLGGVQERNAGADGNSGGERERAALTARLEGYAERLRALAAQVEPLTTAMAGLAQNPSVADEPDLHARVQKFYEDIRRFEDAEDGLAERLQSLRNGSYDERRARFDGARKALHERFNSMSPADFIREYRRLFEEHFPAGREESAGDPQRGADEIGQLVTGAQDYLMDWFSDYTQLLNRAQASGTSAPQITPRVLEALAGVHAVAREVLRDFDILPVEIQPGQTAYDHRLHDAPMIKATTEYPANTVIEVQRTGFRRMSTAEVLRRPQVVISGATTTA